MEAQNRKVDFRAGESREVFLRAPAGSLETSSLGRAGKLSLKPRLPLGKMHRPYLQLWPALPLTLYARKPSDRLPFPLSEATWTLFANARQALWQGVRAAGLGRGDEILAPAFNCGSEIEALVRAQQTVRFFEASESLEPNEEELDSLVNPRTRALLLIHYLGFPQDCVRWRAWCDERNLLLIEDCAHVWHAHLNQRPLGSFGEIVIYSLSKTFGLPEGGVLQSSVRAATPHSPTKPKPISLFRAHAGWLAARAGWVPHAHRKDIAPIQQGPFFPGHPLAFEDPREATPSTMFLLRRLKPFDVAARRSSNYKQLLGEFADRVPAAFRELPVGASPLIFPVESGEPSSLMGHFRRHGVAARPWWSFLHPVLPAKQFPNALAWRRRFIALPVHQDLGAREMERVATALRTA